jgi:hypothetical protein
LSYEVTLLGCTGVWALDSLVGVYGVTLIELFCSNGLSCFLFAIGDVSLIGGFFSAWLADGWVVAGWLLVAAI